MSTSRLQHVAAVVVIGLTAACGPSAVQLRQAREARYQGSREEVFRLARAAVEASIRVQAADPAAGTILTETSWYEPDGSRTGTGDRDRQGGLAVRTEAGAVSLGFRIIVGGEAPPFQVVVEPVAHELRSNYSAPYPYLPGDPAMPGWISGKVDNLQLDVHHRLARWLAPPTVAQN